MYSLFVTRLQYFMSHWQQSQVNPFSKNVSNTSFILTHTQYKGVSTKYFFIQKLNQLLKNRVSIYTIYTIYTQQSVEYEQSDRRRSWSFVQQIDTIVASGEIWSFYTSTRDSALWRLSTRIFLFVAIRQIMIPNVIPIPVIIKKISK